MDKVRISSADRSRARASPDPALAHRPPACATWRTRQVARAKNAALQALALSKASSVRRHVSRAICSSKARSTENWYWLRDIGRARARAWSAASTGCGLHGNAEHGAGSSTPKRNTSSAVPVLRSRNSKRAAYHLHWRYRASSDNRAPASGRGLILRRYRWRKASLLSANDRTTAIRITARGDLTERHPVPQTLVGKGLQPGEIARRALRRCAGRRSEVADQPHRPP